MHGFLVEAEEDVDYSLDLKGRQRGRWRAWSPTEDERRGLVENFTKASCRGMPPFPSKIYSKLTNRCSSIIESIPNLFLIRNSTIPNRQSDVESFFPWRQT
jgi:hypothetical protein